MENSQLGRAGHDGFRPSSLPLSIFSFSLFGNHVQLARTVGLDRAHGLCNSRDMAIKRLDHVSVVEDLAAVIAFFIALGMTIEGEMPVEGPWVDRVNGLESVQVDIVMMRTRRWARAA
jgi:hypothetical protein